MNTMNFSARGLPFVDFRHLTVDDSAPCFICVKRVPEPPNIQGKKYLRNFGTFAALPPLTRMKAAGWEAEGERNPLPLLQYGL
jgi:hypothetical protein